MPRLRIVDDCGSGEFVGQYVVEYDPTREGVSPSGRAMICHLVTTPDPARAKTFADAGEVFEYWRQSNGFRPDGKPNRPLTAFTVEIG